MVNSGDSHSHQYHAVRQLKDMEQPVHSGYIRDAAALKGRIGERYILSAHNLSLQEGLTEIAAAAEAP